MRPTIVPVGLFGLARNTMRVRSLTHPRIASTSAVRLASAAATGVAPTPRVAIGYIVNPCSLWTVSSPGPA